MDGVERVGSTLASLRNPGRGRIPPLLFVTSFILFVKLLQNNLRFSLKGYLGDLTEPGED
jgi:hypothetical protein